MLSLSISVVFLVGGYRIGEGSMTLGTLIALVTYMQRASGPAQSLMGLYVAYQRARVSLVRVRELAAERPAVQPLDAAQGIIVSGRGDLKLEGLVSVIQVLGYQSCKGSTVIFQRVAG